MEIVAAKHPDKVLEHDGRKLRKASAWVFGGYAGGQMLRLGSNLIMTRLLAPDMFGIMALANVLVAGVQMLTDMGIQKSIIQSRNGDREAFLNTAWILQILRGISLAAIVCGVAIALWVTAPGLSPSSVYADPDLPIVLAILASSLVIGGVRTTKSATANRQLHLGRITAIDLLAQVAAITTMITWASKSPDVWALVVGTIVSTIVKISAEFLWLPGAKNKWQWEASHAREIFHFGKWIFLASLLTYWVLSGDRIILGFDITATEMGIYSIAVFIVSSVRGALDSIMQKVMFPAMSQALRKNESCVDVYYRFRLPIDLLICSISGFLLVSGEQVIQLLYDDRYQQAGSFLTFLSLGLLADRYRGLGLFYQAEGKPKKMMIIAISRAVLLTVGLPIALYKYGFTEAVIFLGAYPLLVVPLQLYLKYQAGLMIFSREITYTFFLIPGIAAGYLFQFASEQLIH